MKKNNNTWLWIVVLVVIILVLAGLVMGRRGGSDSGRMHTTGGKEYSHILLPVGQNPHSHLVDLDDEGSGVSTEDKGHQHAVQNETDVGLCQEGRIRPAGHTHNIAEYIVSK